MARLRAHWDEGATAWTDHVRSGELGTLDLSPDTVPDGAEFWVEIEPLLAPVYVAGERFRFNSEGSMETRRIGGGPLSITYETDY